MKYFAKVTTIEEAKSLYKRLALANHSDITGGSDEAMKEINAEFDMVFGFLKHRAPTSVKTEDSATTYRTEFYTANGWKGDKYDSSLHGQDIAKLLREYVKMIYPTWKFSIISEYNAITVAVMEGPMTVFAPIEESIQKGIRNGSILSMYQNDEAYMRKCFTEKREEAYSQLNPFYLDEDISLSDFAKAMFKDINSFLKDYTRDDSDSMIDYYSCNLYVSLHIGKWNKPFKVVEKVARISPTKIVKGAALLTK